jgi:hypothetical protein
MLDLLEELNPAGAQEADRWIARMVRKALLSQPMPRRRPLRLVPPRHRLISYHLDDEAWNMWMASVIRSKG